MSTLDSPDQSPRTGKRAKTVPPYWLLLSLMPAMDALVMLAVAAGIYTCFAGTMDDAGEKYSIAALSLTVLVILAFEVQGVYETESLTPPQAQLAPIIITSLGVSILVLGIGFFSELLNGSAAAWGGVTIAGGTALLCLYRFAVHSLLRRSAVAGRMSRNVVLVGFGEQTQRLLNPMQPVAQPWNRIVGAFDDRATRRGHDGMGCTVLENFDDLIDFVRTQHVDDIVIALSWSAEGRIGGLVDRLEELPVNVHVGMDLADFPFEGSVYTQIGRMPVLNVRRKPLERWNGVMKSLEDKMVGGLMVVVLGPLMILIALAIKIESRGPVFFRQPRYGLNNQIFEIYKFRTMYHDRPPDEGVPQATKNDRRVTKIGRILRRTSLDELPQVFNVLQGSMSVVGPRPHAISHNEQYAQVVRGYFSRHRVKPGITGWAQVNGFRGETDTPDKMAARVRYDVSYIENWSLALDIKVLIRTIFVGFIHPNAY